MTSANSSGRVLAVGAWMALLMALAACGGKGGTLAGLTGSAGGSGDKAVLPQVNLAGWSMPSLPDVVPPEPADLRAVRARLAPYALPLDPTAREASGVIKTLPDSSILVHAAYPSPGYFDFRVSTPFNAQSPAQFFVNGTLACSGPMAGRYVQVGLVTNAVYNYAMDPDGNPLTNDANPSYLFNQSALLLFTNDASGNPFAAPFDYNGKGGIGAAQPVPAAGFDFSLRFTPAGAAGGLVALQINGGPFGADFGYRKNNWGWWPDEDYSQARLIVMSYSYDPNATPFSVNVTNVVADDPAYTPPNDGGTGNVMIDATALPNAKFSIWNPTGPTPYTGSLSTNTVYDATAGGTLLDGDQFYLQFDIDPALQPDDLVLYPQRVGGVAVVTVTPTGLTLGGFLSNWFDVPAGTRTLHLQPGAYNRITNDMTAGLPSAQYVLQDASTAATIGGPYLTDESNIKRVVIANFSRYTPIFSPLAYPAAGSNGAFSGAAEQIYPTSWPANWFQVGSGSITEGGAATATSMDNYFTQAGVVNTMDSDAFIRCELDASAVNSPPYRLRVTGVGNITASLAIAAAPRNVVSLLRGLTTVHARDNTGQNSNNFTTDPGHQLSGATSVTVTIGGGGGTLTATVLPVRITDDPALPDPDAAGMVTGTSPWTATLDFLLQYGTGPYTVALDGDYGAAWDDGTAGRTYPVSLSPLAAPGLYSGTANLTNHSPGTYTFALRVTDGAGAQYIYVWPNPVTLSGSGWTVSHPGPDTTADNRGRFNTMAIVDGNPAMGYFDFTTDDLYYVRATDANGANWGTPIRVDGAGADRGWDASLAVINGNPAISYTGEGGAIGGGGLYYCRATDADGTAWGAPVTLSGSNCQYTSLAFVNGKPSIAFYFAGGDQLYYWRGSDANGTAWAAPTLLLSGTGMWPSMAVVNGNPAIAFYGGDPFYIRATDADGTAWGSAIDIAPSPADSGWHSSLAVVNGNPAVAYYDQSDGDLRYVRATDADGTAWAAYVTVDSTGTVGEFPSLCFILGSPSISYWDVLNDDLKYARSSDTIGLGWFPPLAIDTDQCGDYSCLLDVNGQPGISYDTVANGGDLRFIRFY